MRMQNLPPRGVPPGAALVLIVAVGALLRLWGALHGLRDGYIYHPDAVLVVQQAWNHLLGMPWREGQFGPVYGALLTLATRGMEDGARFVGYPVDWSFALIASASSLMSTLLGTATILLVYLLSARAYDSGAGLIAAALFAVSPLHTLHSHYPYRDGPMVFFLTGALVACVGIARRPSVPGFVMATVSGLLGAAIKPAGLGIVLPLLTATLVAARRVRQRWVLWTAGGLFTVAAVTVFFVATRSVARAAHYLATLHPATALRPVERALTGLLEWIGPLELLAALLAAVMAVRRRQSSDVVLLSFLGPALVAVLLRGSDDRIFVFLLPVTAVLIGGAASELWRAAPPWRSVRVGVVLAVGSLLLVGGVTSAKQGLLLALPDTRALAGRWFTAHVPRTTPLAMEEYYPLGVNEWPLARMFVPHLPLSTATAGADLLVTSTLEHGRYLSWPDRSERLIAFFQAVQNGLPRVKTFALAPLGFIDPTIEVYGTWSWAGEPQRLALPRPYDTGWNMGAALLSPGPYDRDDRTFRLAGPQRYTATLISPDPVDEVVVFVLNGPDPANLRVRVGWTARTRTLAPGESRALRFKPWWRFPGRPTLYGLEAGLRSEGSWALLQVRSGARDIGETYAQWGRWDDALPYLERAAATRPGDVDTQLLLATAHRQLGRPEAARAVLERLAAARPGYLDRARDLANGSTASGLWTRAFRELTGVDPALLSSALGQSFEAEQLPKVGGARHEESAASGGVSIVFEPGRDPAGVIADGPYEVHQPAGAYVAHFRLRAQADARGPLAILKVFAETRLLADRLVTAGDLGPGGEYVELPVPFVHTDHGRRVAFRVEATGRGGFALDRVRLVPDLRETLRRRLAAAGGPPP